MYNHYDNSHILSMTREGPYMIFGEKGKLVALTLHRFLCTGTRPSFVIRWWYPHACCQWHKEDLSDSWIKDTRWKVMVIFGYWTLHHFHTQTQQSLHIDWWYFLRCGNDFWRIYTDFWVKIWQVKIKLRVLIVATGGFVSVGYLYLQQNAYQSQSYRHDRLDVQDFPSRCIKLTKYTW